MVVILYPEKLCVLFRCFKRFNSSIIFHFWMLLLISHTYRTEAPLLSPNRPCLRFLLKTLRISQQCPGTFSFSCLAQRQVFSWKALCTWILIPPPPKASKAAAICIPRHASLPQKLTASFSLLLYTSEAADGLLSYCWGVNLSCVKLSVLKEAVSLAVVVVTVGSITVLDGDQPFLSSQR